jgi:hypothetical protein
MPKDGFKIAKRKVIAALESGTYQHESERESVDTKNLLLMGGVTPANIIEVIQKSRGQDHSCTAHHQIVSVWVHVIRRDGWYIKFYFLEPDTIFISVHM